MTNGEFIRAQLVSFGVNDADFMVALENVDPDEELDLETAERAMIPLLEVLAVKPYLKNINENGFSLSWDMSKIGWWYRYLCKKYGIKPDANVMEALGLSVIVDRTSKW